MKTSDRALRNGIFGWGNLNKTLKGPQCCNNYVLWLITRLFPNQEWVLIHVGKFIKSDRSILYPNKYGWQGFCHKSRLVLVKRFLEAIIIVSVLDGGDECNGQKRQYATDGDKRMTHKQSRIALSRDPSGSKYNDVFISLSAGAVPTRQLFGVVIEQTPRQVHPGYC